VDRQAVLAHQAFFEEIGDRIAGVVIGDGKTVQAFFTGSRDVFLRARHSVAREKGVGVKVDVEGHRREASLRRAKCKASLSRNGPWCAKPSAWATRRFSCAKAASPRAA